MRLVLSFVLLAPASAFACAMPAARLEAPPLVVDAKAPAPTPGGSLEALFRQIDVAAAQGMEHIQGVVQPLVPGGAEVQAPVPVIPEVVAPTPVPST